MATFGLAMKRIFRIFILSLFVLSGCREASPGEQRVNQATPAATERPWKLICLGGSTTVGVGVDPQHAFPAILEDILNAEASAVKVVNAGIRGETLAGAEARIAWILQQRLDAFLIALGEEAADTQLSAEQEALLWQRLLTSLRNAYPDIPVYILPLFATSGPKDAEMWSQLRETFKLQVLALEVRTQIAENPLSVEEHAILAEDLSEYLKEAVDAYYQHKTEQ